MKYLIPLSFLFAVLMISSCDQIPCNDVECGDYGTCDESTELCNCDPGFSISATTGLCACPENSAYSDTAQICICDEGWLMNPLTSTCFNPCDLINCGLNGSCDFSTGECNCDPGYGPENLSPCEAYNLKFESDWTGSHVDQNSTSTGPYTMTLIAMQEPDRVLFQNFMNLYCQGPQLAVDADGTVADPGQTGGSLNSVCPQWIISAASFELINGNTLEVIATVTPGISGPPQNLIGTYLRD
ncbi:MAG: hypothetical protein ACI97X_001099 [Oceanospirillaceae bacterium]|jgi:hypothetical protein